ncbi:hypothetical protein A1F94_010431 [Pyrenophora tritici-repentis]|uniref:UBA-e1-C domain containing protein n=1 Tax=Pyrenophora tritici-repentis TaxID=45151 RepID=A0A2W1ETP8_9PLEO|nr:hypothetical protein PtrV1_11617 [Pyrenophora tritici-repentis]KAF7564929.1 UBA-e1-C domain containing protein [Pyrenophora tritici-repentis]KAG9378662.1 hypothetical protein A1F94_010431 [Pyrenophora tritici-repentis]KAI0584365.1 hypothetical protein Alg215_03137 [Pyrenophora tritici-repentis]KAI0591789.1 hypothetical protein Alg130_00930 [Pyrenophora tritici-repentis]
MVYFEQHVVLPPETQERVDKLIWILGLIVITGIFLVVLTIVLGLGIGYVIWKKGSRGKASVTWQFDGQEEMTKTK